MPCVSETVVTLSISYNLINIFMFYNSFQIFNTLLITVNSALISILELIDLYPVLSMLNVSAEVVHWYIE